MGVPEEVVEFKIAEIRNRTARLNFETAKLRSETTKLEMVSVGYSPNEPRRQLLNRLFKRFSRRTK